jgi:hypothetical protein
VVDVEFIRERVRHLYCANMAFEPRRKSDTIRYEMAREHIENGQHLGCRPCFFAHANLGLRGSAASRLDCGLQSAEKSPIRLWLTGTREYKIQYDPFYS